MKELSNRTATFTDSVIRRMTRISDMYGAVNLSQGFPDFDPPAQLLKSLGNIATDPKPLYHQYSIRGGPKGGCRPPPAWHCHNRRRAPDPRP